MTTSDDGAVSVSCWQIRKSQDSLRRAPHDVRQLFPRQLRQQLLDDAGQLFVSRLFYDPWKIRRPQQTTRPKTLHAVFRDVQPLVPAGEIAIWPCLFAEGVLT